MKAIDRAHKEVERRQYQNYVEDLSESEIRKTIFMIGAYILCLMVATALAIYDASAQEINDLIPNDSISTESPEVVTIKTPAMHEVGSVFSGSSGTETPNGLYGVGLPMPAYGDYNNFSAEKIASIKAGQLANAIKKGWYKSGMELRFLASKRSAQEDLILYSDTITAHQRAIKEGKDVNFYIDEIKAGRYSVARLRRDVEICGTGFEIYPDSGICNEFVTHQATEQNYYHAKLSVYQLSLRNQELEAKCGYGAPTAKVCIDQGSIKDGSGGFLWKSEADPKARCKGGTTILLAKDQASITEIELLDVNQNVIFKPSYFGKLDDSRPRFCAEGRPGSSFSGPLYVRYEENCKTVSNPANRED